MVEGERADHDILLTVENDMKHVVEDIGEIKRYIHAHPCPSDMCQEHDSRITTLETTVKVVATIVAIELPILAAAILAFIFGGH